MSIRTKIFFACESFLRVPPLFLIDEIFRTSFGFGGRPFKYSTEQSSGPSHPVDTVIINSNLVSIGNSSGEDVLQQETNEGTSGGSSLDYIADYLKESWMSSVVFVKNESLRINDPAIAIKSEEVASSIKAFTELTEEFSHDLLFTGQILGSFVLFFAAIVMFMLATDNLIKLYSYLLSFLTLYLAYVTPMLQFTINISDVFFLSMNLTLRTGFAAVFFICKTWSNAQVTPENRIPAQLEPFLLSLFFLTGIMDIPPVLFTFIVTVLHYPLLSSIPKLYNFLMMSWGETKRVQNEYGLSHLIQVESSRLRVNSVFRLFWITRAAYDAFYRCCDEPFSLIIRYVMIHGTETFTGIVGLTVTVAAICHQIGDLLLWILYLGSNNEVDLNRFGSISTVLFFILSLQCGLTSLDPEKRLDRLVKNVALLGTALFHALHQLVAPILHAFRSFQAVQVRAAILSSVFLCFSLGLTLSLLRWSTVSTWSLAVLALAIEFKIKVIISLIISLVVYLSQLVQYPDIIERTVSFFRRVLPHTVMRFFDQLYDQISHEDMVFYLKTVANIAEFVTGIFLFMNAVWIFLFESTSAIRAIGMSVHAYFNIWCEAQKGIRIYSQRKTASKKIMSLKDATSEQLRSRNDDVCSICYEGFESAKVTNCGHLFHQVCLRKWLYLQNTCPMCHDLLYKDEAAETNSNVLELIDLPHVDPNNENGVDEAYRNLRVQVENLHLDNNHLSENSEDGEDSDDSNDSLFREINSEDSDSFVEIESDGDTPNGGHPHNRDNRDREGNNDDVGLNGANGRGLVLFL